LVPKERFDFEAKNIKIWNVNLTQNMKLPEGLRPIIREDVWHWLAQISPQIPDHNKGFSTRLPHTVSSYLLNRKDQFQFGSSA
jgi:hypothetical protein